MPYYEQRHVAESCTCRRNVLTAGVCKVSVYFTRNRLISLVHMYLFKCTCTSQYLKLDGTVANYMINSFHVYVMFIVFRCSFELWKISYQQFSLLLSDDAKERLEFESFKKFLAQQTNKPEGNS